MEHFTSDLQRLTAEGYFTRLGYLGLGLIVVLSVLCLGLIAVKVYRGVAANRTKRKLTARWYHPSTRVYYQKKEFDVATVPLEIQGIPIDEMICDLELVANGKKR